MSYAEDIIKLRKKIIDAATLGVVGQDSKGTFEAMLVQIMNEAEKNRQQCNTQAENLRKQAAMMDGQAGAFASVTSIVYNVLNGFVKNAERDIHEQERMAQERAEKEAAMEAAARLQSQDSVNTNQ